MELETEGGRLEVSNILENRYAPVAQLDRATGFGPVGRGFESLRAYHFVHKLILRLGEKNNLR